MGLNNYEVQDIIEKLQKGEMLPDDYKYKLFPTKQKEYELVYGGKMRKEDILANEDGVFPVPLQVDKVYNGEREAFADGWRNIIVFGDNLQFLKIVYQDEDPLIKGRVKGKVKLIYIDPPFATIQDFRGSEDQKAYQDKVAGTIFLEFLRKRLILMQELLADDGFIIVHLDYRYVFEIKCLMDEIFDKSNFRNEIIVKRSTKSVQAQFERISTLAVSNYTLLFYSKNSSTRLPKLTSKLAAEEKGKWDTYWRSPDRPTMRYEIFGIKPEKGQWRWEANRGYRAKRNYEDFLSKGGTDDTLDEYYIEQLHESGNKLDFVRIGPSGSVQYYVPPRSTVMSNNMWIDISCFR